MMHPFLRRFVAILAAVSMPICGQVHTAQAAVIGTDTVVQLADRTQAISRIEAQLARDEVQQAFIRLGVDPGEAKARVSVLGDAEIAQLDRELAKLPAGGDGGWTFAVVLLIVLVVLFAMGKLQYR
ncbi:MAG TPA: PA2779 family protein [Burkholderiales bacterium]|nr:PA2779 family protein [Burkholderiales bacterium]